MQGKRAHPRCQAAIPDHPHADYHGWSSIPAAFRDIAWRDPDAPMLAERTVAGWRTWTRRQVERNVRALAASLNQLGVTPGDRVMLVSGNRPAFLIADLAIMATGGVAVPAYTTNTEDDHAHVLRDSGAVAAIVSTPELAQGVARAAGGGSSCRALVQMDAGSPDDFPEDGRAPTAYQWSDILDAAVAEIKRDATACLIYTSGTGGALRGVMLS